MMQIRKAMSRDLECIRELTRETMADLPEILSPGRSGIFPVASLRRSDPGRYP